jgi:hypothetical protein
VFGLKDVLENIAFVSAFVGAGALLSLVGVRVVFAGAGLLTFALAGDGAPAFRGHRSAVRSDERSGRRVFVQP